MEFSIDRGNYRDHIGKGDCFLDRNWSAEVDRFQKVNLGRFQVWNKSKQTWG